jgi:hypothetical protein
VNRHLDDTPLALALIDQETFDLRKPSKLHFVAEVQTLFTLGEPQEASGDVMKLDTDSSVKLREVRNSLLLALNTEERTMVELLQATCKQTYAVAEQEAMHVICGDKHYLNAVRKSEELSFPFGLPSFMIVQVKRFDSKLNKIATDITGDCMTLIIGEIPYN